jgi:GxxExxY protein
VKKENELSKIIIACALEAHRTLGGPGLLESIYEEALVHELGQHSADVQRQVLLPVNYKGKVLANSLRIDLLVDNLVIVESKATTQYHTVFESQLLTYLRVSGL